MVDDLNTLIARGEEPEHWRFVTDTYPDGSWFCRRCGDVHPEGFDPTDSDDA